MELPASQPRFRAADSTETPCVEAAAAARDSPFDVAGAHVILVDDDARTRGRLRRLLSDQFMVRAFADGAEALCAAREFRPDLMLSDVIRSGMDGLALVRAVRADVVTRTTPIILLSARSGEDAAVAGLEAGADDYLVKPFASRELVARVCARITNARLRTQLAASEERRRLAGELHDSLSQHLAGADIIAANLQRLVQRQPEAVPEALEHLRVMTRAALAETRVLLHEVHPETVTAQPLGELVAHLAELVQSRLPMDVAFERQDLDPRPLPTDVRHAFYRIAQESLYNVIKHSGAIGVEIYVKDTPAWAELQVRDNGRGFDTMSGGGEGLLTMRERAASIGAMLQITSAPGEGTEVVARWSRV